MTNEPRTILVSGGGGSLMDHVMDATTYTIQEKIDAEILRELTMYINDSHCPFSVELDTPQSPRVGDWMQTYSGRKFWPLDPRADDVCLEDIANALAKICRFNGHCKEFYSVAQHSVLVSLHCPPKLALVGLLHDAAEAYVGDMVTPLKNYSPEFKGHENGVYGAIAERFGLPSQVPVEVKRVDLTLLATEARDLMCSEVAAAWGLTCEPLTEKIRPWAPKEALYRFMHRYRELTALTLPA